jgi:serine/threonine protein phosphatase 1
MPPDAVTYAIGDVHGCLSKLERLFERCLRHGDDRPSRFVLIGDYIDRGPDSCGVIERLMKAQRGHHEVICLCGNHEAMMLEAIRTGDDGLWRLNGAAQTLESYGIGRLDQLPPRHIDWVASLPLSFDDGRRYFVHAGVNPAAPLDQQIAQDQLWIREPFLSSRRDYGRLIVHGHTPVVTGRPDLRANRLNLDTAAVFGGPLTAAFFTGDVTEPAGFLDDTDQFA